MSSDFFKELSSITGENIPSAENLSTEQKAALAAHYRNTVGWTVKQVGEHLGCNPSYVYRLLKMKLHIKKDFETLYARVINRIKIRTMMVIMSMMVNQDLPETIAM